MVFVSAAVETVPFEQRNGQPLNSEYNRVTLSAAYAADGDKNMTPVMCSFWLQVMVLDRTSDAFKKLQRVASSMHTTFEEEGMEPHVAICLSMRLKLQEPVMFEQMAADA